MNGVIGMTSLLSSTKLTPEQEECVDTIRNSGDALLIIINDILDFSKIEAGQVELEQHPFNLHDCVSSAVNLLTHRAQEKGLHLHQYIDRDVPARVTGDPTRLRQVIVNLLSNAIKFTDNGEVQITVTLTHQSEANGYEVLFQIKDTGIGIPADRMDRLFRSFSQVDASTTRRFGGTGLGLAISKRLSEIMGGSMWVESMLGAGSTFSFTTKLGGNSCSNPEMLSADQCLSFVKKKVLIVDEIDLEQNLLGKMLRNWQIQTHATFSYDDVKSWAQQGHPCDAIVIDMDLKFSDPLAIAAHLKQDKQTRNTPLILVSTLHAALDAEKATAIKSLFAARISKPLKQSQVERVLEDIFNQNDRTRFFNTSNKPPVLIIDDNRLNRAITQRILDLQNWKVDAIDTGQAALQIIENKQYGIVILSTELKDTRVQSIVKAIYTSVEAAHPHLILLTTEDGYTWNDGFTEPEILRIPLKQDALLRALEPAVQPEPSLL